MDKDNNRSGNIAAFVCLAAGIFLAIGVRLLFHACIHDDGTQGSCHWAQQMTGAMGILIAVMSFLMILFRERQAKAAISVCVLCAGILTALIPGSIIRLCMMPDMSCNAMMKPWTIAISIVISLAGLAGIFLNMKKKA